MRVHSISCVYIDTIRLFQCVLLHGIGGKAWGKEHAGKSTTMEGRTGGKNSQGRWKIEIGNAVIEWNRRDWMRIDYFNIKLLINNLYIIDLDIGVFIIDAYFLRRFLDKNYVTNAKLGYHLQLFIDYMNLFNNNNQQSNITYIHIYCTCI